MSVIGATALPQVYEISGSLLYCSFWYSGYYSNSADSAASHDLTRNRLIHDLVSSSGCQANTNCNEAHYQSMTDSQLNSACEAARTTTKWCSRCLVLQHFRSQASCDQMCWTAQKDTVIDELLRLDATTQDQASIQGVSENDLVSQCESVTPIDWCNAAFCTQSTTYQAAVAGGCPAERAEHKAWFVQFASGETKEANE